MRFREIKEIREVRSEEEKRRSKNIKDIEPADNITIEEAIEILQKQWTL